MVGGRYLVYVYPSRGVITVYSSTGSKIREERFSGRVVLGGARRVTVVEGFAGHGVVAYYEVEPCFSKRMWGVEVSPCGTSSGEE